MKSDYAARGIQLRELASGFSFRSNDALSPWLSRMWQETAPRFSRALLETLALIAYRQPITRGEIEDVRGVAVSSNIMRHLSGKRVGQTGRSERGTRGRPALYATTSKFLDYFGLTRLSDLPTEDAFNQLLLDQQQAPPHQPQSTEAQTSEGSTPNQEQLH